MVLVAAAVAVGACEKSDAIVVVTVAADQDVAGVFRLRAVASNAGTGATRTFPAAATADITFPTTFSLTVPRDRTGALDIALEGLDGGDVVIANGADTVDLRGADSVAVTIALHAGAPTCGNGQLDPGEDCDDGDRVSGGSCDFLCRTLGAGPGTGGMGGSGTGGTGGGACAIELLTNGNFDDTSGWTANDPSGRPLIYDQTGLNPAQAPQAHSPPNMAWLGYDVDDRTITLSQSLMVPADAVTLTVSGFRLIRTDEDSQSVYDTANLALDSSAGRLNLRPQPWSNLDRSNAWLDFTYTVDAAPYAGTTATFVIHVEMDDDVNTSFFFDTLSVVADVCP